MISCGSCRSRPPSVIRLGFRAVTRWCVTSPGSLGAVEKFRFFDLEVHAFADPAAAVAEVQAEGLIRPTGRIYRQTYVLFLRAAGGKIAFLREYFDPVRAAKALDAPILGLGP